MDRNAMIDLAAAQTALRAQQEACAARNAAYLASRPDPEPTMWERVKGWFAALTPISHGNKERM